MRIHLISIGGAVMHNMALALAQEGHTVSGSDDEIFEPSRSRLQNAGLLPEKMGWDPNRITADIDLIILGMHAKPDNPELKAANDKGIPVQSFPEYVYNHSKEKTRIVVGGSHGKTTTTAMIMHVMKEAGLDFDYLVGSQLEGFETMVRFSNAPYMVIEGDEYLTSPIDRRPKFLWYKPQLAILTGIAWDHVNVFPTFKEYLTQFGLFIESIPPEGKLFYFDSDPYLQQMTQSQSIETFPYHSLDYKVADGKTWVSFAGKEYPFKAFGSHNMQNMKAAYEICREIGIDETEIIESLSTFGGTARRLEIVHESDDVIIIRDFAHSPSKVRASTQAVREQYPDHNLVALFELHTFSSLNKSFIPQYTNTLDPADHALVYFNPEVVEMKRLETIDKSFVNDAFGEVEVFTDSKKLLESAKSHQNGKTVYLAMSSGTFNNSDIYHLAAGS